MSRRKHIGSNFGQKVDWECCATTPKSATRRRLDGRGHRAPLSIPAAFASCWINRLGSCACLGRVGGGACPARRSRRLGRRRVLGHRQLLYVRPWDGSPRFRRCVRGRGKVSTMVGGGVAGGTANQRHRTSEHDVVVGLGLGRDVLRRWPVLCAVRLDCKAQQRLRWASKVLIAC